MGRTESAKGIHTSPQKAGIQNMPLDPPKDELKLMAKMMPIINQGETNAKVYKGLWTEAEFTKSVSDFFSYCNNVEMKPTKPALRVWLAVDQSTYSEWEKFPDRHGYKTLIVKKANDIMEMVLQGQIDKYPTGSIFLLKTSHGHVESSRIDIGDARQSDLKADEVNEVVKQLGLGSII